MLKSKPAPSLRQQRSFRTLQVPVGSDNRYKELLIFLFIASFLRGYSEPSALFLPQEPHLGILPGFIGIAVAPVPIPDEFCIFAAVDPDFNRIFLAGMHRFRPEEKNGTGSGKERKDFQRCICSNQRASFVIQVVPEVIPAAFFREIDFPAGCALFRDRTDH